MKPSLFGHQLLKNNIEYSRIIVKKVTTKELKFQIQVRKKLEKMMVVTK